MGATSALVFRNLVCLSLFAFIANTTLLAFKTFGCVFTTTIVSLNIPGGVLSTDFVKQLKKDRCFHELD